MLFSDFLGDIHISILHISIVGVLEPLHTSASDASGDTPPSFLEADTLQIFIYDISVVEISGISTCDSIQNFRRGKRYIEKLNCTLAKST